MNEVFFVGDGPTWRLILFVLSCCNFLPAAVAEGWQIDLNFVFVTLPHALSSFRVTLLQLISYSHLCKICPYEFAVHKGDCVALSSVDFEVQSLPKITLVRSVGEENLVLKYNGMIIGQSASCSLGIRGKMVKNDQPILSLHTILPLGATVTFRLRFCDAIRLGISRTKVHCSYEGVWTLFSCWDRIFTFPQKDTLVQFISSANGVWISWGDTVVAWECISVRVRERPARWRFILELQSARSWRYRH